LVEAYNVLSNEEKRKEYDSQPQFQLRKKRRVASRTTQKVDTEKYKDFPLMRAKFKESSSLLDKVRSIFSKKEKTSKTPKYNPKEADMHFALGISLCENERFLEQAPAEFNKVIQFDPDFIEAYYNLGIVYYRLGKFDEALVNFHKVLAKDKNDQQARLMLQLLREEEF